MALGNTLNILRAPERSTPPVQTLWNDDLVKNMHNVLGQLAQQITAQPFGGLPAGASRPTFIGANTFWLDTTTATDPIVKLFDGTDDITVMTFDYSANTVSPSGAELVNDTSPQLGGDLDLNGNVITGLVIGTDVQALDATLTSLAAVDGVSGDIFYASGTDVWARLAKDTDGMFLKQVSGIPAWSLVPGITRYTAINTTSGTAHGWTTIPAGTNRLTLSLHDVSLDGSNSLQVQLGLSSGYVTSGYLGRVSEASNNSPFSSGFRLNRFPESSGAFWSGFVTLVRLDGNIWAETGNIAARANGGNVSAGSISLAGEVDRIQLKPTGSDDFDAGKISLLSEV